MTRGLLNSIQCEIQHKDDQMAWVDSCCLQLALRNKDDTYIFQMDSPEARKEWITGRFLAVMFMLVPKMFICHRLFLQIIDIVIAQAKHISHISDK